MDKAEAIKRIKDHIMVHHIGEYPHIKIAEALNMAISALATDNNVGVKNSCDYCQEDADGYMRMFGAFAITNPFHGKEWFLETAHCKPRNIFFCPKCGRKLAEPPKEE